MPEKKLEFEISATEKFKSSFEELNKQMRQSERIARDVAERGIASDKHLRQFKRLVDSAKDFGKEMGIGVPGGIGGAMIPTGPIGTGVTTGAGGGGVLGAAFLARMGIRAIPIAGAITAFIGTIRALNRRGKELVEKFDQAATTMGMYSGTLAEAQKGTITLRARTNILSRRYGESAESIIELGRVLSSEMGARQGEIFGQRNRRGMIQDILAQSLLTGMAPAELANFSGTYERFGGGRFLPAGAAGYAVNQLNLTGGRRTEFVRAVTEAIREGFSRGVVVSGQDVVRSMGLFNIMGLQAFRGEYERTGNLLEATRRAELLRGPQATRLWRGFQGTMQRAAQFGETPETGLMLMAARAAMPTAGPLQLGIELERGFQGPQGARIFRQLIRIAQAYGEQRAPFMLRQMAGGQGTLEQMQLLMRASRRMSDEDFESYAKAKVPELFGTQAEEKTRRAEKIALDNTTALRTIMRSNMAMSNTLRDLGNEVTKMISPAVVNLGNIISNVHQDGAIIIRSVEDKSGRVTKRGFYQPVKG